MKRQTKSNTTLDTNSVQAGTFLCDSFGVDLIEILKKMISDLSEEKLSVMLNGTGAATKEELLSLIENATASLPKEKVVNLIMESPWGPMIRKLLGGNN